MKAILQTPLATSAESIQVTVRRDGIATSLVGLFQGPAAAGTVAMIAAPEIFTPAETFDVIATPAGPIPANTALTVVIGVAP